MPNVTVYNLYAGTISIPGGYYVKPIPVGGHAIFHVDDADEFTGDSRVASLVSSGYIRVERSSTDAASRPLPVYTTATLPAANTQPAGTVVWNSTERAIYESDGTSWSSQITGNSSRLLAGGTNIATARFVELNTAGALVTAPTATGRWAGVSTEAITAATEGKVQMGGRVEVMPSAAITANMQLVCEPGGFAAPYQSADVSLGTAVAGADASDDLTQTNLPDMISAICAADETGNTMVIYGDVGGTYTKETVTLGTAGTYTSTNTFAAVYCVQITATAAGNIDVKDATLTANIFPQIVGTTAARMYGAITPDVATDSKGHQVRVYAGGANASDCVVWGTDYAGAEQAEVVTMNGTTPVESTLAYRSLDKVFIGADGIAWNAGVTSQYDQDVLKDEKAQIRAWAFEAEATAGSTVGVELLPQNTSLVQGTFPVPYWSGLYSGNPGAATVDVTIPGVAATDVIVATMSARTNAVTLDMAAYQAANTVRLTWSANPGAGTVVSVLVFRP